jgi:hypothetical protein
MTAYDYLVRGWKAERQGRWGDGLRAYDLAIEVDRKLAEAHERRAALLDNHPNLQSAKPST